MTKALVMAPGVPGAPGAVPSQNIAVAREEPKSPMISPFERDDNLPAEARAFFPKRLLVKDSNVPTEGPKSFITNRFEGDDTIPESADGMAFCLQNRFNKDKAVPVKQPNSLMANQVQANDAVPTQKPASSTTNPEMTGNATPMEETPPSSSSTNDKVVSMSKMYSSMQAVFLLADEMTGELLTILNTIASSHGATVDKDSLAGPLLRLHELIEYASYEAKDGLTKALRVDFRDVESHLQAVTARREQLLAGRDKLIEKWQEAALVMHLPADPDFFTHVCRLGEDLEDTRRRIANAGKHDAVEEAVEVEAEGRPQRSSGSETSSPMVPTPVQSDGTNSQENTPDSSQDSHSKVASKTSETICEKGGEKGELWKWPAIIPSKCTSL